MNDTQNDDPSIRVTQDNSLAEQPVTIPHPLALPVISPKKKWYKRKALLVSLLLVIVLGGAGTGYAYYAVTSKPVETKAQNVATSPEPSPSETPKTYAPFALQYSAEKQLNVKGTDCSVTESTVYQKPTAGGDAVAAITIPDYQQIAKQVPTDNGYVLLITAPSCYSKKGPGLWLSKDSGKTYSQLYEGTPQPKDNYGEQISSALLAEDNKTILFASVPNPNGKGTVKTLDTDSKKTTDTFSASEPGVRLVGYDQKKKLVYYHAGCYNCAGYNFSTPIVHDIAKNTDTPLFDDKEYMASAPVMNSTFSKLLRVKSKGERFPKVDLSYVVEEYDITSKKTAMIASFKRTDESGNIVAGYTADGSIYYTNDKNLFLLTGSKPAVFLTAVKPISDVYYVDKTRATLKQGDQMAGSAINYMAGTKTSTTLVEYKYPTAILGLSLQ